MTKSILALDPDLSTGWAWTDGKRLKAGEWDLTLDDPKGKVTIETWADRCRDLWVHLRNMDYAQSIDLIVIERIHAQHGPDVLTQRLIGVMLLAWEWSDDIPPPQYIECSPSSWKKALGRGNMNKAQYRRAAQRYWKLDELPGEDEAAALGMLAWAQGRYK